MSAIVQKFGTPFCMIQNEKKKIPCKILAQSVKGTKSILKKKYYWT